ADLPAERTWRVRQTLCRLWRRPCRRFQGVVEGTRGCFVLGTSEGRTVLGSRRSDCQAIFRQPELADHPSAAEPAHPLAEAAIRCLDEEASPRKKGDSSRP